MVLGADVSVRTVLEVQGGSEPHDLIWKVGVEPHVVCGVLGARKMPK